MCCAGNGLEGLHLRCATRSEARWELRGAEVSELRVWPHEPIVRSRPENDPLVDTFLAFLLRDPAEVRAAEVDRAPNAGELHVVHEDVAALLEEPTRVDEVEEHPLEPVIAIG